MCLELAREELALELGVLSDVRGDHALDLAVLEEDTETWKEVLEGKRS